MCPGLIRGSGGDAGSVFLIPGGCGKRCFFVSSVARFSLAVREFFRGGTARRMRHSRVAGGGGLWRRCTRPPPRPPLLTALSSVRSRAPTLPASPPKVYNHTRPHLHQSQENMNIIFADLSWYAISLTYHPASPMTVFTSYNVHNHTHPHPQQLQQHYYFSLPRLVAPPHFITAFSTSYSICVV